MTFDNIEQNLRPVVEEIAQIQECDPDEIHLTDIPILAVPCACIAYAKGLHMPHLKEFVHRLYKDTYKDLGKHNDKDPKPVDVGEMFQSYDGERHKDSHLTLIK